MIFAMEKDPSALAQIDQLCRILRATDLIGRSCRIQDGHLPTFQEIAMQIAR
jgi:hypothetical protein